MIAGANLLSANLALLLEFYLLSISVFSTRSRKSRWPQNGVSPPGIRAAFWGVVVASWAEGGEIDGRSSSGVQAVEIRLVKTLPVSRIP